MFLTLPGPFVSSGWLATHLDHPDPVILDGELLDAAAIAIAFGAVRLDLSRPVIANCGSGATEGALAFGLHLAGKNAVIVYDGSCIEWGSPGNTPAQTGARA